MLFTPQIRRRSNWCKTPYSLSFLLKLFLRLPPCNNLRRRRTLPRSLRTSVARRRRGGGRIRGGGRPRRRRRPSRMLRASK
jgi:hypothetical protein